MDDEQLGSLLGRPPHHVRQLRLSRGWKKKGNSTSRPMSPLRRVAKELASRPETLPVLRRIVHFAKILHQDELEQFADLLKQYLATFDVVTVGDMVTVENLVLIQIQMHRLAQHQKHYEELSNELMESGNKEDALEIRDKALSLVSEMRDLAVQFEKYQRMLATTREQRLKQSRDSEIRFQQIVSQLEQSDQRQRMLKLAKLLEMATEVKHKQMSKEGFLIAADTSASGEHPPTVTEVPTSTKSMREALSDG